MTMPPMQPASGPPMQPASGPPVSPAGGSPTTPPVPAGGGKRRWGRVIGVAVVIAVVGFAGAGAGAYVAMRSHELAQATVDCRSGAGQCIPTLKASSVIDAIKGQGFGCKSDTYGSNCELMIGQLRFEARVEIGDDHISSILLTASQPDGDQKSEAILPYLVWFASLPYADDAVTTSDITKWVTQQVENHKSTKAKVGDYTYELDASKGTAVKLDFRGRWE